MNKTDETLVLAALLAEAFSLPDPWMAINGVAVAQTMGWPNKGDPDNSLCKINDLLSKLQEHAPDELQKEILLAMAGLTGLAVSLQSTGPEQEGMRAFMQSCSLLVTNQETCH